MSAGHLAETVPAHRQLECLDETQQRAERFLSPQSVWPAGENGSLRERPSTGLAAML